MNLENRAKRRIILPIVLGGALIAGVIGLTPLALNLQPKEPEISDQITERKFKEDYNKALENYSRQLSLSGYDNALIPTFASNRDLMEFVRAYSQDYSSKQ